jgi:hypothetical protein
VIGFVALVVMLYRWMLTRSAAAPSARL